MLRITVDAVVGSQVLFSSVTCTSVCLLECSFEDFLKELKQSKRKNIRQERKKVGYPRC